METVGPARMSTEAKGVLTITTVLSVMPPGVETVCPARMSTETKGVLTFTTVLTVGGKVLTVGGKTARLSTEVG